MNLLIIFLRKVQEFIYHVKKEKGKQLQQEKKVLYSKGFLTSLSELVCRNGKATIIYNVYISPVSARLQCIAQGSQIDAPQNETNINFHNSPPDEG